MPTDLKLSGGLLLRDIGDASLALPTGGLVGDWDPSLVTGVADGASLTSLPESVAGKNATTGLGSPTYETNEINSLSIVRFSGSGQTLVTPSMSSVAQPFWIFAVIKPNAWSSGKRVWDGLSVNTTAMTQNSVTPQYAIYGGSAFQPVTQAIAARYAVFVAKYNGASSLLSINGATAATGSPGTTAFSGLTIGGAGGATAGFETNMDLARMLVYNNSVVVADVLAYLGQRYGLDQRRMIFADGDSLTAGTGSSGGNDYPAQLQALKGTASWEVVNGGNVGDTITGMTTTGVAQTDSYINNLPAQATVVAWGGTNDMAAGTTDGATTYNNYKTYCAARRAVGWKIAAVTVLPRSAVGTDVNFETNRQTFNSSVRTNWATFADYLVDVAADSRIGDAGDELDTTYYSGDKVHLNNTGYAIVAGLVSSVVV